MLESFPFDPHPAGAGGTAGPNSPDHGAIMIEVHVDGEKVFETRSVWDLIAWIKGVQHAMTETVTDLLPPKRKTGHSKDTTGKIPA